MNNDDKEFDDLIIYSSDEDTKEEVSTPEAEPLNIEDETVIQTGLTKEEEEELDRYEMSKTATNEEKPPKKRALPAKKTIMKTFLWVLGIGVLVSALSVASTLDFVKDYKNNFRRNLAHIMPALFLEEISDEEIANDQRVVSGDDGNIIVNRVNKEVDFGSGKETENKYVFDVKRSVLVPFEGAAEGSFDTYDKGIVCGRANSLSYINKNGEIEWEIETPISSPIVKCEGNYILVAENGGNKFLLYNGVECLFETTSSSKIISANVSSNGDVVLVVDKSGYKGGVNVYNRYGKEVFVWSSGQNDVLCADISSATRRVAVGLVNTDDTVYSIIRTFDITKEESTSAVRFDDTIIFDIGYYGDTITGYGDNAMICMTSSGRVIADRRYNKVNIAHYAHDDDGNKAILFDSDNLPILQTYNKKGSIKHELTTEELSSSLAIKDNSVIYNSGRDILLRKGSASTIRLYTATMDIQNLYLIDSNTFAVVHSNSLEIVVMK